VQHRELVVWRREHEPIAALVEPAYLRSGGNQRQSVALTMP
jgi:hypothetical protein